MTRSLFRLLILSSLSFVSVLPVFAQRVEVENRRSQNAQINGQVRYADGGAPANNITVELTSFTGGGSIQVQTDRNGKFSFQNLQATQINVSVRAPGYKEERQFVNLSTTPSQYLQFSLKSDGSGTARGAAPAVIDLKVPAPARKEFDEANKAILSGKPETAIVHLEKAISLHPDFLEATLLLGTVYMDTKQWDKAENVLRRAIQINPKSTAAYFTLGEAFLQQKKYADAEKVIKDGLKIEERSWQGHYALGRLYWEQNDYVKAGREIAKTLQLKPDLAEAHLLGANILLRARKAEDALMEFKEYLRLEPDGKFAPQAKEMVAKIEKALAEQKK